MVKDAKQQIIDRIFAIADQVDWMYLPQPAKRLYYEEWTSDPQIGGVLAEIVGQENVRVHLKDTIMKLYARSRQPELPALLEAMSVHYDEITRKYEKPDAILCDGIALYTIAPAKQWKTSLMSAYERAYDARGLTKNLLFFTEHVTGRFVDRSYQEMIEAAGLKLGVQVQWVV